MLIDIFMTYIIITICIMFTYNINIFTIYETLFRNAIKNL